MKRIADTVKRVAMAAALAVALTFSTEPARAGLQPDQTINGTNVVTALSTNQYAGTIFDCSKSTDITFEFSYTCTNANKMTVGAGATFTLDGAVNASNTDLWQSNVITVVVANTGSSNSAVGLTNLAAGYKYPAYRVGQIWNTNGTGTNLSSFKVRCFTKNGV